MKKLMAVLLTVAMLLSLSAAALADEPMRMCWWGSESSNKIYLGVMDMFVEATGIDVEPEYYSWDDYWTKMNTLAAGHDLPDSLRMDYQYIKSYVEKGLLMDLTPLVESGAIDVSDVPESVLSGGMINGGLYGINAGSNGLCMVTNRKLVEDAGMEVPTNEMTWDEFEQWVLEFHEKTGKFGFDMEGLDFGSFRIIAREHGGELYNADQTAAGFDTQVLVDYFASVKRMHDAGAIQNVAETTVDVGKENYFFSKGEAAAIWTTTDSSTTFAKLLKDNYGLLSYTVYPGAAATKAMYVKPSQFMSIAATSENVDAAVAYINYWTNDEACNLFIAGRRGVPISPKMADIVGASLDDISGNMFAYMNVLNEYSSKLNDPEPTCHGELAKEFENAQASVLFGEATPEAAAESFVAFINNALNN